MSHDWTATAGDDDQIRVPLDRRPLLADVVDVCAQSPRLWVLFRDAVEATQCLRSNHGVQPQNVVEYWTARLDYALGELADSEELQDALTAVLDPTEANHLSNQLDGRVGDLVGEDWHRLGLDDEPNRDVPDVVPDLSHYDPTRS